MKLIDKIVEDRQTNMKLRNVNFNILTTLLGDLDSLGKRDTITDDQVLSKIKKYIENNNFTLKYIVQQDSELLRLENEVLGSYLPTTLTESEIKNIILNDIEGDISMPTVMQYFKKHYKNQVDNPTVIKIFNIMSNGVKSITQQELQLRNKILQG